MTRTKYNHGWLGIRVEKLNGTGKLLRSMGWLKADSANKNNPAGFNWMRYGQPESAYNGEMIQKLAAAGLDGLVGWISDAQYERGIGMTRKQWQATRRIDSGVLHDYYEQ